MKYIYVVSDGTGETALRFVRAFLVHFPKSEVTLRRFGNVNIEKAADILKKALIEKPLVVTTIANNDLRLTISNLFIQNNIDIMDLFGYFIEKFETFLQEKAIKASGLLHTISDKYFEKIKAIEYTVMHDDNKSAKDLDKADIILIGLSRTSKTPLSIYLSQEGYKVANFAIVKGEKLPDTLYSINQDKIFFLCISPERLYEIRQERAKKLGVKSYAQKSRIYEEIEYAESLYKKHPQWKKIDVTKKSIEEAASEIIEHLSKKI